MQIKIWNFRFEVLSSETSNIEFRSSKLQTSNLKFWSFFLESKKLHIWSYRVSFGDVIIMILFEKGYLIAIVNSIKLSPNYPLTLINFLSCMKYKGIVWYKQTLNLKMGGTVYLWSLARHPHLIIFSIIEFECDKMIRNYSSFWFIYSCLNWKHCFSDLRASLMMMIGLVLKFASCHHS